MDGSYTRYLLRNTQYGSYETPTPHQKGLDFAQEQWKRLDFVAPYDRPRFIRRLANKEVTKASNPYTDEFLRGVETKIQQLVTRLDQQVGNEYTN